MFYTRFLKWEHLRNIYKYNFSCLQDIGGLWYLRQYMKDSQKSYSEAKESCHKVQFVQL